MLDTPKLPAARVGYVARLNSVVDYIDTHLGEPLNFRALATVAHLSPWHFHRLFHAMMGESVAERVRRRRLEVAARLLVATPPVPVHAVALDTGFGSAAVFTRTFKLHFGVTPTAWRQGAHRTWIEGHRKQMHVIQRSLRKSHPMSDETAAGDCSIVDMKVDLKRLPAWRVAYLRHVGPYGSPGIERMWERFKGWALHNGLQEGGLFVGVSHDSADIAMPAVCRYDACVTVDTMFRPRQDVGVQETPGGLHACTRFLGSSHDIYEAWLRFYSQWLPDSGYQPDDKPCIEVYGADVAVDPGTGVFSCDLCLPIRPL